MSTLLPIGACESVGAMPPTGKTAIISVCLLEYVTLRIETVSSEKRIMHATTAVMPNRAKSAPRGFLKSIALTASALALGGADCFAELSKSEAGKKRPNIIFLLTDDQRDIITPIMGESITRFLEIAPKDRPFSLSVSFSIPHGSQTSSMHSWTEPANKNARLKDHPVYGEMNSSLRTFIPAEIPLSPKVSVKASGNIFECMMV